VPHEVEVVAVLDLLDAAGAAGASVPAALVAVGRAVGGQRGDALGQAGRALLLGAVWSEAWAGAPVVLRPVERALRPAWEDGVPSSGLLQAAAETLRRDRQARAAEAAAALAVRLVLPLGLCHLPAFVVVGLVPVLLSLVGDVLG
jgi:pilus assembly protein TadC